MEEECCELDFRDSEDAPAEAVFAFNYKALENIKLE